MMCAMRRTFGPQRRRSGAISVSHFLISRIVIALIGFVGVAMFVDQHTLTIGGAMAFNPEVVWNKWDAVWYERIARVRLWL